MKKSKSIILNEIVLSAADIMEEHAEYLNIVAKQFDDNGDIERAESLRKEIDSISQAINLMRRLEGCWAV